MKKMKKKAANNRLMLFGTISIIVIVFFIYTLLSYVIQVKDLQKEHIRIENELSLLKDEEQNLKNEIEKLKDEDYLARFARENYMYSKDGEYIIRIPDKENIEPLINVENNEGNSWLFLFPALFLLLIFFKKIIVR